MPYADFNTATLRDLSSPGAPSRADPCASQCQPTCPACGGLKCLCHPRFFPGQNLTDEDLNRFVKYVIEKNRLHNRYLQGWGVACGLEVVCDPCEGGRVIVRTGYALSPCGDDIVVCKDHPVNVCDLIQTCREPRQPICDPPQPETPEECREGNLNWVLAICYDERPSRGITALTGSGDSACRSSCSCGGSTSRSCGCGGKGNGSDATSAGSSGRSSGRYAPQCEPTQMCEGYRFIVYPAPRPSRSGLGAVGAGVSIERSESGLRQDMLWAWMFANRAKFGPLLERLLCCVTRAMELRAEAEQGRKVEGLEALDNYVLYAQALQEFAADFALHRCAFVKKTRDQHEEAKSYVYSKRQPAVMRIDLGDVNERVSRLDSIWLEIVAECFCSALLPACPAPAASNCVPLAVLSVQRGDCRVLEICNWQERKLLITWPTIMYWLSWLPWTYLRRWVMALCCADGRERYAFWALQLMLGVAFMGIKSQPQALSMMALRARPVAAAAAPPGPAPAQPQPEADPVAQALRSDNLLDHMLHEFDRLRAGGATAAPAWATLAARAADGSALAPLVGQAASTDREARDLAVRLNVENLSVQVADLKTMVQKQEEVIKALKIIDSGSHR